jgi:hypothetical protein
MNDMRDGACPHCTQKTIVAIDMASAFDVLLQEAALFTYAHVTALWQRQRPIGWSEMFSQPRPPEAPRPDLRGTVFEQLRLYVCQSCGQAQWVVDDPKRLRDAQPVLGTPDTPYR